MRTCNAVHRLNRAPAAAYRLSASKCAAIDASTSSGDWVQSACACMNLRHVHEREHAWSHRLELACVLEQLENRHALCGEHSAQNSVTAAASRRTRPCHRRQAHLKRLRMDSTLSSTRPLLSARDSSRCIIACTSGVRMGRAKLQLQQRQGMSGRRHLLAARKHKSKAHFGTKALHYVEPACA
jgi:hypothetical protein